MIQNDPEFSPAVKLVVRIFSALALAALLASYGLWHGERHLAVFGGVTGVACGLWQGERAVWALFSQLPHSSR